MMPALKHSGSTAGQSPSRNGGSLLEAAARTQVTARNTAYANVKGTAGHSGHWSEDSGHLRARTETVRVRECSRVDRQAQGLSFGHT